eukprot:11339832-Ditylum_brightwellii.AAC.1
MTVSLRSFVFHLFLILSGCGADANRFARRNLRFDYDSDTELEIFAKKSLALSSSKDEPKNELAQDKDSRWGHESGLQGSQTPMGKTSRTDEIHDGEDASTKIIKRNLHQVSTPFSSPSPPYNPMEVFDPGCNVTDCGVCEPIVVHPPFKTWYAKAWPSLGIVKFFEKTKDTGEHILRAKKQEGPGICFGRDVSIGYEGHNALVGAPGYSESTLTNIGKVYHYDLANTATSSKKGSGHDHALFDLPLMKGEQVGSSYGTNIGLSSNSHHVAISEPGYNGGEGRIILFAYMGYWHEVAVFAGDISHGVTGLNMFGTYGLEVNLDVSEITVSAERYGAVHFHRTEETCVSHCIDAHASCQIIASGTLPMYAKSSHHSHSLDHSNSHKSYSSHALLIGDEVADFCRPPSLYNTPATIYDPTHYINCTTYRDTCPSYAEMCDPLPSGVGCEEGFTCDIDTRTCRIPELGESCSVEAGKNCIDGHVCDIGSHTCRKPDRTELCLSEVGCLDGYICGEDGVCRFPIVTEPCTQSVPCNGTLFCNEESGLCQAPGFKEECDPLLWGCHRDLVCGGDYTCRLPIDLESCHYDKICRGTYMCDESTAGNWDCRTPVEFEPCVQSIGCLGLFQCDGVSGVCRKPIATETCNMDMGCNTTYVCDNSSDTCRLPDEAETCDVTVGCSGTLRCGADELCRKPVVGEACELGPGPGCLGGIVCAIEENLCRLPFPEEPCNHDAFDFPECAPTLACGVDDTCILPTFDETCDTEFNCEAKFRCSEEKVCRYPIENEFCDEDIPCELPFVCNNETGRCRKPRDGEECEEIHGCYSTHQCGDGNPRLCRLPEPGEYCTESEGCSHKSMKCELSVCTLPDADETCNTNIGCRSQLVCNNDTNTCRLPITHEICDSLKEGCADGLWCIDSNCTLPAEAFQKCSSDFGCDNFYVCDETSLQCREPIDMEQCNATCAFGYTCDIDTCRRPRIEGGVGEE